MQLPVLKIGHIESGLPIIQGGMGVGISLSGLASAVANEGGIGVIAAAMIGIGDPDIAVHGSEVHMRALKREIRRARSLTRGILGVNIMVALTNFEDMVRTAIEEEIDIIFAGAGLPLSLPSFLREGSRTRLAPIVSSGRAAAAICSKWLSRYNYLPDAFVVEGPLAGGHLGFKPQQIDSPEFTLEHLVADVIRTVGPFEENAGKAIPVIAAGGIYTGSDIHRFITLGASGVQMGTRFVATFECDADDAFKQMYVDARPEDLMVINSPVGLPGRVIRNAFVDSMKNGGRKPVKCPYQCIKTCDPQKSPYCIAMALEHARRGKFKHGFAFAGQNAHRVTEIVSVKNLIAALKEEYIRAAA